MRNRRASLRRRAVGLTAFAAGALLSAPAWAVEGGQSIYLLGSGGPQTAVLPPYQGVYLTNMLYYYDGQTGLNRSLVLHGSIAAGVKGSAAADFPALTWVPTTSLLGGTFALSGIAVIGQSWVKANAVLTGPRGNQFTVSQGDTTGFVAGDPLLQAALGWTLGPTIHVQVVDFVNIPIGQYNNGALANLAFHRWGDDLSVAVTRLNPKDGWDLSAKTGFTFNGSNPDTNYRSGTEWHLEGSVEKQITPAWALGIQAYQYAQITGDSGSGAKLGPFEGRVTGFGGETAYNFKIGIVPITMRLHGMAEFNAHDRLQGHSIWLDFAMPLHVKLPTGAPG